MSTEFENVRQVDAAALRNTPPDVRYAQTLLGPESGAHACTIAYIRTPPGAGSPAGMHVHDVDQIFFVMEGTMQIDIEGRRQALTPGSLVILPSGAPHRNWNEGPGSTVHLAFNVPMPDPTQPFSKPIGKPTSK